MQYVVNQYVMARVRTERPSAWYISNKFSDHLTYPSRSSRLRRKLIHRQVRHGLPDRCL